MWVATFFLFPVEWFQGGNGDRNYLMGHREVAHGGRFRAKLRNGNAAVWDWKIISRSRFGIVVLCTIGAAMLSLSAVLVSPFGLEASMQGWVATVL